MLPTALSLTAWSPAPLARCPRTTVHVVCPTGTMAFSAGQIRTFTKTSHHDVVTSDKLLPGFLMVVTDHSIDSTPDADLDQLFEDGDPTTAAADQGAATKARNRLSRLNARRKARPLQIVAIVNALERVGLTVVQNKHEGKWYLRIGITEAELMVAAEYMKLSKKLKPVQVPTVEKTMTGNDVVKRDVHGGFLPYSIARADGFVGGKAHLNVGLDYDKLCPRPAVKWGKGPAPYGRSVSGKTMAKTDHAHYGGIFQRPLLATDDMTGAGAGSAPGSGASPTSLFSGSERLQVIMWKVREEADLDVYFDRDDEQVTTSRTTDDERVTTKVVASSTAACILGIALSSV